MCTARTTVHAHSRSFLGEIGAILALPRVVELKLLVASLAPEGDTRRPSQGIVPLLNRFATQHLPPEPKVRNWLGRVAGK